MARCVVVAALCAVATVEAITTMMTFEWGSERSVTVEFRPGQERRATLANLKALLARSSATPFG